MDDKHHIVERSKAAAVVAYEKAKEMDRQHNILEKTTEFVVYMWESVKEINRKHRVLERAIEGVGRGVSFVAGKILEKVNPRLEGVSKEDDDEVPGPRSTG